MAFLATVTLGFIACNNAPVPAEEAAECDSTLVEETAEVADTCVIDTFCVE